MNAGQIKALTEAIESKCTNDLVDYLAAKTYLMTWAVEAVEGSRYVGYGCIPQGRFVDQETVEYLKVAMEFSHIDQLVEYLNEAIVSEWRRVRSDLELTWHVRVFGLVDDPAYEAIGIDALTNNLAALNHPHGGWLFH